MQKKTRRLALAKETVLPLEPSLAPVAGGATENRTCTLNRTCYCTLDRTCLC